MCRGGGATRVCDTDALCLRATRWTIGQELSADWPRFLQGHPPRKRRQPTELRRPGTAAAGSPNADAAAPPAGAEPRRRPPRGRPRRASPPAVQSRHHPREGQEARRRQVDRRLGVGVVLHRVAPLGAVGAVGVELLEDVGPRPQLHVRHGAVVLVGVGSLDGRAEQHRRLAVQAAAQVGDLMLQAVRERGAVAHDQRGAPGVGPQDVRQPAARPGGVGGGAG